MVSERTYEAEVGLETRAYVEPPLLDSHTSYLAMPDPASAAVHVSRTDAVVPIVAPATGVAATFVTVGASASTTIESEAIGPTLPRASCHWTYTVREPSPVARFHGIAAP